MLALTRRIKVLLVDPDAEVREVVAALLKYAGCDVTVAGDAERALDAARTLRPEVALIEPRLVGCDGLALVREIKRLGVPVILVTGDKLDEALEGHGADAVIGKPFNMPELAAALVRLVPGTLR